MAVGHRAGHGVKKVEARPESGALDLEECFYRADPYQIFGRTHADLAQPGRRLRPHIADLAAHRTPPFFRQPRNDSMNIAHSRCIPARSSPSKRATSGLSTSHTPKS